MFKSKSFLGVDIGTTAIKVGEFEAREGTTVLKNYGLLESFEYLDDAGVALQTSSFRLVEPVVVEYLKKLVAQMKPETKTVYAALPAFSAFTTLVELPQMSMEEVAKTIPFQSKKYIPAPLSSVKIDWLPVGERITDAGTKVQQVFLVSIANEVIEKYKRIFKSAGLHLEYLEVENLTAARALSTGVEGVTAVVNIGSRSTSISIAENGALKHAAQTDFAGASLTHALASGLNIAPRRAEVIKIQKGLHGVGGERALSTLMTPMLDVILNEVRRAASNFEENYKKTVSSAVLTGGGARLIGIEDYFQEQLGIPTSVGAAFEKIAYPEFLAPLVGRLNSTFSIAIGLGMYGGE